MKQGNITGGHCIVGLVSTEPKKWSVLYQKPPGKFTDAEWLWNQGWFCNQKWLILKPKPMIPWFGNQKWFWNQKTLFWNQGWFRNQGQLETKAAPRTLFARTLFARALLSPPRPHPTPQAFGDDAMQSVAARILVAEWCGFWLLNRAEFGCGIVFFSCRIVVFWLRNRIWFWLRNCRNLVKESPKYGCRIGLYSKLTSMRIRLIDCLIDGWINGLKDWSCWLYWLNWLYLLSLILWWWWWWWWWWWCCVRDSHRSLCCRCQQHQVSHDAKCQKLPFFFTPFSAYARRWPPKKRGFGS